MDRTFDMRVMAFLDGSMDNIERSNFLEELHASPDKMDILNQYRRLDNAFELSRRPIDVPITLQQTLATRLPVLGETLLPSAPAATTVVRTTIASRKKSWIAAIAGCLLLFSAIAYIAMEPGVSSDRIAPAKAGDETSTEIRTLKSVNTADVAFAPATRPAASTAESSPSMGSETSATEETPASVPRSAERDVFPISMLAASPVLPSAATVPVRDVVAFGYGMIDSDIIVYAQSGLMQSIASGARGSSREATPVMLLAGVRYDLTSRFSAMLEIGRSTFQQEALYERRNPLVEGNNADLLVIDRAVISDVRNWLRFQLGYQLIEWEAWRIEVRGGAGMLLGGEQAMMFTTGITTQYALSRILQAHIGIQFSGARMAPGNSLTTEVEAGEEITGVIQKASSARSMTSRAVEFNLGFGLRLW